MLIKSTSLSTQSDRLVPELDTIVPLESTKAYNMVDIIHAVSPTSVCLSAGLAVCMSWCFGSVRKCRTHTPSEQAPQARHGVAQSQGTEEHVVGRVSGCGHPAGLDGPEGGAALGPAEPRGPELALCGAMCPEPGAEVGWLFTHFCLGSHAQRAFCFSRERRVHEASCDIVEGHVCRSEEHRSPLYLFLGVVGSWLIKWRGQCWSELEAPVHGHCLPPSCVLPCVLWALSSSCLIQPRWLCGDSLSQGPGSPRDLFLLPRAVGSRRESAADPCCRDHCLLSTMWALFLQHALLWPWPSLLCTSQLSCLSLTVSVLPFLLEPSTLSGNFLPGPAWTLPCS